MTYPEKVLAEYVEQLSFHDLPPEVVERTKYHLLDTLGCIILGAQTPPLNKMLSIIKRFGGAGSSTLIGKDYRTDCLNAALFNGAAAHAYEFDDLHRLSVIHPGAVIIPATLALGESLNVNGRTILLAIVAGYEVMIRIGMALGKSHYYFWHTTATAGVFGSAAACSKLLQLDSESILNAFGNAGTQASGLWEFKSDGAMSKLLHTGRASQSGMLSALLASEGFTGAKRILGGEKGLLKATSKDYHLEKVDENLGEKFRLLETSVKLYPSCGHTHPAIHAILKLQKRAHFPISDIHEVIVRTYSAAVDVAGVENPVNPYQAKFSLKYCVAIALKEGGVKLQHFTERVLEDLTLRKLMSKIKIIIDPELDKAYPNEWLTSITILLKNGNKLEESAAYPDGDPEDPFWKQQVISKFMNLTSGILEESVGKEVVKKTLSFDSLSDVRDFITLLRISHTL